MPLSSKKRSNTSIGRIACPSPRLIYHIRLVSKTGLCIVASTRILVLPDTLGGDNSSGAVKDQILSSRLPQPASFSVISGISSPARPRSRTGPRSDSHFTPSSATHLKLWNPQERADVTPTARWHALQNPRENQEPRTTNPRATWCLFFFFGRAVLLVACL